MKKLQVIQPVVFHLHNIMDTVDKTERGCQVWQPLSLKTHR